MSVWLVRLVGLVRVGWVGLLVSEVNMLVNAFEDVFLCFGASLSGIRNLNHCGSTADVQFQCNLNELNLGVHCTAEATRGFEEELVEQFMVSMLLVMLSWMLAMVLSRTLARDMVLTRKLAMVLTRELILVWAMTGAESTKTVVSGCTQI